MPETSFAKFLYQQFPEARSSRIGPLKNQVPHFSGVARIPQDRDSP